jgi:hypothetical protein
MASQTVHCYFKNLTDKTLTLDHEKTDSGTYTPLWRPPHTIAPGAVGEWRTESDGLFGFGDTEGHAIYSISSDDGTEFIDIYWDNPMVGINKSSIHITEDFTGKTSKVFEGAHQIDGEPPPNWVKMRDGDVEAWIDGILFPVYIISNWSSSNDANANFAIRRKAEVSSPLLGPPESGPISSKVNTTQQPAQWEGRWMSNAVCVTLASLGGKNMSASITDTTINPPIQFQETFQLGHPGFLFDTFAIAVQQEFNSISNIAASAAIRVASKICQAEHTIENNVQERIHKEIYAEVDQKNEKISPEKLTRTANAISTLNKLSRSSVMLSNGVCLTLYDEFQGGNKVDGYLLYERILPVLGFKQASEKLRFVTMLH